MAGKSTLSPECKETRERLRDLAKEIPGTLGGNEARNIGQAIDALEKLVMISIERMESKLHRRLKAIKDQAEQEADMPEELQGLTGAAFRRKAREMNFRMEQRREAIEAEEPPEGETNVTIRDDGEKFIEAGGKRIRLA